MPSFFGHPSVGTSFVFIFGSVPVKGITEWPSQDLNSRSRSFWLPSWYHLGYCSNLGEVTLGCPWLAQSQKYTLRPCPDKNKWRPNTFHTGQPCVLNPTTYEAVQGLTKSPSSPIKAVTPDRSLWPLSSN